jgi:hypothetical protein
METVYTWQATDASGKTYKYENEPFPYESLKCWCVDEGAVKYFGDSLLDVPWEHSLTKVLVKDRYKEGYKDGYDECLRQQREE